MIIALSQEDERTSSRGPRPARPRRPATATTTTTAPGGTDSDQRHPGHPGHPGRPASDTGRPARALRRLEAEAEAEAEVEVKDGSSQSEDEEEEEDHGSYYWDASTMAPLNSASAVSAIPRLSCLAAQLTRTQAAVARLRAYSFRPFRYGTASSVSRRAAVLLLLYADRRGDLRVVITMRAASLRSFSGMPIPSAHTA